MNGESLGIGDLDIGIDTIGMDQYLEDIRAYVIDETCNMIDNVADIEDAINAGWQGISRDRFLSGFSTMRDYIKDDLRKEYNDLQYRILELESNYLEQDANLFDEQSVTAP